jgi:hypothetical protein
MPLGLDIKIRFRLFRVYLGSRRSMLSAFGVGLLVPMMAAYLFVINQSPIPIPLDTSAIVQSVHEAQDAEIAKSETGIYHVKRIISEGRDKSDFVALSAGQTAPEVVTRVDAVETWQHNDTALALIESNGTARSFEVYLAREHDGVLGLHHYGPINQQPEEEREVYDLAHDLASLYTDFTSLNRPGVPVLPKGATLLELTDDVARFIYTPAEGLEIEAVVELETKLVVEVIIYVLDEEGNRFEMTTIRYADRSVIPAEKFEEIFDTQKYAYETIS